MPPTQDRLPLPGKGRAARDDVREARAPCSLRHRLVGPVHRAASRLLLRKLTRTRSRSADNLEILVNHLKCAAFELPISPDERFGNVDLPGLCEQLGEAGFLHQSGGDWHWIDEAYPADTISLRSVTSDNFVIIDTTGEERGKPEVIGEVDFSSALVRFQHPAPICS
jgi:ATP-dependent helicase HRQ1-like protein